MNCPNCGAQNDADARFCAECGAPLENQDIEATIAGQFLRDDDDSDKTILSSPDELVADAKTVSVDQGQLSAIIAEDDGVTVTKPESTPPPVPDFLVADAGDGDSPGSAESGSGGGFFATGGDGDSGRKRMMIIVGVIVVLFLCCCCCALVGGIAGSEDIQRELEDFISQVTLFPSYYPSFV